MAKEFIQLEAEIKTSYNNYVFSQVKNKEGVDGNINPYYYKSSVQNILSEVKKNEVGQQRQSMLLLYEAGIKICSFYLTYERLKQSAVKNKFWQVLKETNLLLDKLAHSIILMGNKPKEFEMKKAISLEIKHFKYTVKDHFGIDIDKGPFSDKFMELLDESEYKHLQPTQPDKTEMDIKPSARQKLCEQFNEDVLLRDFEIYGQGLAMNEFLQQELDYHELQRIEHLKKSHGNRAMFSLHAKKVIQTLLKKKSSPPKEENKSIDRFLTDTSKADLLKIIQIKYKEEKGKSLAILIYLLSTEFELIQINPSSKIKSLSHFIKLFNGAGYEAVRKHFVPNEETLFISSENNELQTKRSELKELIENYDKTA